MNGRLLIWFSVTGLTIAMCLAAAAGIAKGTAHAHCAQVQAILSAYRQEFGIWPKTLTEAKEKMTAEGLRENLSTRYQFQAKRTGPETGPKSEYEISFSTFMSRYTETFVIGSDMEVSHLRHAFKKVDLMLPPARTGGGDTLGKGGD